MWVVNVVGHKILGRKRCGSLKNVGCKKCGLWVVNVVGRERCGSLMVWVVNIVGRKCCGSLKSVGR